MPELEFLDRALHRDITMALKEQGPMTVMELAACTKHNRNTIRSHIKQFMQLDETKQKTGSGAGRPATYYSLKLYNPVRHSHPDILD